MFRIYLYMYMYAAIQQLNKEQTKTTVRSPDADTEFSDIIARVLQVGTFVLFLFKIYLYYVLWTPIDLMKGNSFTLERQEADDILQKLFLLQTTKINLCFSQIHAPKQAVNVIALYVSSDETVSAF